MAEEKDDGGKFYPVMGSMIKEFGISRRDWLAGLAMQGFLADWDHILPVDMEIISDKSYEQADAMIQRGKL